MGGFAGRERLRFSGLRGDLLLREMGPEDGSWTNTFMGNDGVPFEIELTWNRGRVEPLREWWQRHPYRLRRGRL